MTRALADDWCRGADCVAATREGAGGVSVQVVEGWRDYAGGAFATQFSRVLEGAPGSLRELEQAMRDQGASVLAFADHVEYAKAQIVMEWAVNLAAFAATFLMPAGIGLVVGGLLRKAIVNLVSKRLLAMLVTVGQRIGSMALPRITGTLAQRPLAKFLLGGGVLSPPAEHLKEQLEELFITSGALTMSDRWGTEFADEQLAHTSLATAAGTSVNPVVRNTLGRAVGGAVDWMGSRLRIPEGVRRHLVIAATSGSTNGVTSPIGSHFATTVLSPEQVYDRSFASAVADGFVDSAIGAVLRSSPQTAAHDAGEALRRIGTTTPPRPPTPPFPVRPPALPPSLPPSPPSPLPVESGMPMPAPDGRAPVPAPVTERLPVPTPTPAPDGQGTPTPPRAPAPAQEGKNIPVPREEPTPAPEGEPVPAPPGHAPRSPGLVVAEVGVPVEADAQVDAQVEVVARAEAVMAADAETVAETWTVPEVSRAANAGAPATAAIAPTTGTHNTVPAPDIPGTVDAAAASGKHLALESSMLDKLVGDPSAADGSLPSRSVQVNPVTNGLYLRDQSVLAASVRQHTPHLGGLLSQCAMLPLTPTLLRRVDPADLARLEALLDSTSPAGYVPSLGALIRPGHPLTDVVPALTNALAEASTSGMDPAVQRLLAVSLAPGASCVDAVEAVVRRWIGDVSGRSNDSVDPAVPRDTVGDLPKLVPESERLTERVGGSFHSCSAHAEPVNLRERSLQLVGKSQEELESDGRRDLAIAQDTADTFFEQNPEGLLVAHVTMYHPDPQTAGEGEFTSHVFVATKGEDDQIHYLDRQTGETSTTWLYQPGWGYGEAGVVAVDLYGLVPDASAEAGVSSAELGGLPTIDLAIQRPAAQGVGAPTAAPYDPQTAFENVRKAAGYRRATQGRLVAAWNRACGRPTAAGLGADVEESARLRAAYDDQRVAETVAVLDEWRTRSQLRPQEFGAIRAPFAAAARRASSDLTADPSRWRTVNPAGPASDPRRGERVDPDAERTGRRYYEPGGHLPPFRHEQEVLERHVPRDPKSLRFVRSTHPKLWSRFVGCGNPGSTDEAVSAIETFRGRPTKSAERTVDGFRDGDPTQPLVADELDGLVRLLDYTGARPQLLVDARSLHRQDRVDAVRAAFQTADAVLGDARPGAYRVDLVTRSDGSVEVEVAFNVEEEIARLRPFGDDIVMVESMLVDADDVPVPLPGLPLGPSNPVDRPPTVDYLRYLGEGTDALVEVPFPAQELPVRDARLAGLHARCELVSSAAGVTFEPAGIRTFAVTTEHGRPFTVEVRLGGSAGRPAVTEPLAAEDLSYFVLRVDEKLSPERVLMAVADQVHQVSARLDLTTDALDAIDDALRDLPSGTVVRNEVAAALADLRAAAYQPAQSVAAAAASRSTAGAVESQRVAHTSAEATLLAARTAAAKLSRVSPADPIAEQAVLTAVDAVEALCEAVAAPDALGLDPRPRSVLSSADGGPVAQLRVAAGLLAEPTSRWYDATRQGSLRSMDARWRALRASRREISDALRDALAPWGLLGSRAGLSGTEGYQHRHELIPAELRPLVVQYGRRGWLSGSPAATPPVDESWLGETVGEDTFRQWTGAQQITLLGPREYGRVRADVWLAGGFSVPLTVTLGEPRDPRDPTRPDPELDSDCSIDADGWHVTIRPGLGPAIARRELAGQTAVVVGIAKDAVAAGVDLDDVDGLRAYVDEASRDVPSAFGVATPVHALPWGQHWTNGYLYAFFAEYDEAGFLTRRQLLTELRRDLLPLRNLSKGIEGAADALKGLPEDLRERVLSRRGRTSRWAVDPKNRLDVAALCRDIAAGTVEPGLTKHVGARSIGAVTNGDSVVGLRIVTKRGTELVVLLEAVPVDGVGGYAERLGRSEPPEGVNEPPPIRYVGKLFQRQDVDEAGLALSYLLATTMADADRCRSLPSDELTLTTLQPGVPSEVAPDDGSGLPTGRDRAAASPGNVAVLKALRARLRTTSGVRAKRLLRAKIYEAVSQLTPGDLDEDLQALQDLDPVLAEFARQTLESSRRRPDVDDNVAVVREAVAKGEYPTRVPPLRRYMRKNFVASGGQGLAGLGLAFYFHKLYVDFVAPFIRFAVPWTAGQVAFAAIGVALGFGAGMARAFAEHRTYLAAEAADIKRRTHEDRQKARHAGGAGATFGSQAADAVIAVVNEVCRGLESNSDMTQRLAELLPRLEQRLVAGETTQDQIVDALSMAMSDDRDPAAEAGSVRRPARRRVQPSPWASVAAAVPPRTPPYSVYFKKNFWPIATRLVTAVALVGFGAGAWGYATVVALGYALRWVLDPVSRMGLDYFKQLNTTERRAQDSAKVLRHERSREARAADDASALLLNVPAVRASLTWSHTVERCVEALELLSDPTKQGTNQLTPASQPRPTTQRVDLTTRPASPAHLADRLPGPFQCIVARTPSELFSGLGSGIPALWFNGPAGTIQIANAFIALMLLAPGDSKGFLEFYRAMDVRNRHDALPFEQERRAAAVAFTHFPALRLASAISTALEGSPSDAIEGIERRRSEVTQRLASLLDQPTATPPQVRNPDEARVLVGTYLSPQPTPKLMPKFAHRLYRDLPNGAVQALLGYAVASLWPGLTPEAADRLATTAAVEKGMTALVLWRANLVAMLDEAKGYNRQLLYEKLREINAVIEAVAAHEQALRPVIDKLADAIVRDRTPARTDAIEEVERFHEFLAAHLPTPPRSGTRDE